MRFKVQVRSYFGWCTVLATADRAVAERDEANRNKFAFVKLPTRIRAEA